MPGHISTSKASQGSSLVSSAETKYNIVKHQLSKLLASQFRNVPRLEQCPDFNTIPKTQFYTISNFHKLVTL